MKKVFPLVFALSVSSTHVLAWGNGNCPFSKEYNNKEASTEQVDKKSNSSEKN